MIDLNIVERERPPGHTMKLGIQISVAGLSILNTISILDNFAALFSPKSSTVGC